MCRFQIEPGQIEGSVCADALNSPWVPTSMNAEAILHELTHAEGLPTEALKAATAQRVEMLPLFLNEIEGYLALEPHARAKQTPLFFYLPSAGRVAGKGRLSTAGTTAE